MDVSAGSSSSTISSSSSSDTEVRAKPSVKKARISRSSKVSVRRKHRMKLRMTKQKQNRRDRKHHQHHSLSESEHRKSSSGMGGPHKRKHRHLPSSSSSEASSETCSNSDASSDENSISSNGISSEQECGSRNLRKHSKSSAKHRKKKAKHLHKKSMAFTKGKKLRAVFREFIAPLMLQVSGPEQLAAQLYSKSLISHATLDKVITLPTSQELKVLHLLMDCDRKIRADPEKLFVFIQVIQGDPSLEELAEKMLHLADGATDAKADQPKRSDPKSGSPKCTTNAETGTRGVVEEGDSNHQQSHSTKDVSGPNYAPITNQPPPVFSAIARYQHYLKSFYNTKPTPVDDKLLIGPCAHYINLAITKKEQLSQEEADEFTRATLHGKVDQILCQKESVHLEDIFVSDSKSPLKCILVEGPPGIGKSTFAWELCHKWDELETMQQYSLVVLLKLREKRVQTCGSLSELLHHPTDPMLGQAVVDGILEGEGMLLILDGLDEFPSTLLKEDNCLIRQLISGSCLPKATVVVTSRPSARMSFELCQPQVSKHIEIVGFTEKDRVKYAESVFHSQPDMLVDFLKYSFNNPTIKALMYIPLVCAIVAQIYKECGGTGKLIPRTMTQLYTALCRSLLRRYLLENSLLNSDDRMPTDFKDLPPDVYKHLCILSEIAYSGILSDELVFYKHELTEGFEHMGFMNECRELYVDRGMESSYNFLHLSLQEYLAAWYISELPIAMQRFYFEWELSTHIGKRHSTSPKKFAVVIPFLAGITGLRNARLQDLHLFQFKKGEVEVNLHICRWLYEAQNYNICQQQLSSLVTVNTTLSEMFSIHDLMSASGIDFYALGYCIAHSRGTWKVIIWWNVFAAMHEIGAEALEMLVNGMRHDSRHHSPTGLITELTFQGTDISVGVAWLKELPRLVLFNLSVLKLCQCRLCPKSFELLAQAIVLMPKLHSLDVSFNARGEAVPESFIESLSSLKQLECLRIIDINISSHGVLKSLTNLIRTSNTLQSLHIGNSSESDLNPLLPVPVLKEVIHNAFAIGILKEFGLYNMTIADIIQLSFLLATNSSITSLILNGKCQFNDGLAYLSQALYTNASLTSVIYSQTWNSKYDRFSSGETITLLDDALKQNTALRNLNLMLNPPCNGLPHLCPLQQLAHQLRRGPCGPQLKLKRAQSLPCLSEYGYSTLEWEFSGRLQDDKLSRNRSTPDLSFIESISSLHPSLAKSLQIPKKKNFRKRKKKKKKKRKQNKHEA